MKPDGNPEDAFFAPANFTRTCFTVTFGGSLFFRSRVPRAIAMQRVSGVSSPDDSPLSSGVAFASCGFAPPQATRSTIQPIQRIGPSLIEGARWIGPAGPLTHQIARRTPPK